MKGFATNDHADYYLGITSITVNGKHAYELKGKFLDDLHNNAFSAPPYEKFKEFNYQLKIDPDVLTSDIVGFKTYDEYKDDWIYEWNKNVPWEYKNEHEDNERYELYGDETHELPVCTVRRFEMIKYSFGYDEEYVAVKQNEYKDLMSRSKDTCQEYQEIFRMMDEGLMDSHAHTFLEHNIMHQSYGSSVVAAATVRIPASIR
uniref:Uncharacterized protein n=1 Tax=Tanacetum cinerariifolium TaxID=118510 RepID=A0A6L2ML70_TANCI|nr:hypothetical protein [Tanacetum cinerariifolium]